jgi:alpha-galactosidase
VQEFFREMRQELPDLVIEVCASGGHRLEPSMLALASMGSFSDAHESLEIPIIAANLHRLILPRQSQIWAVLHANDTLQRLTYSLTSGFLGRLCLSGEIDYLNSEQWSLVLEAIRFYERVAPIIRKGKSRLYQQIGTAWRHPQGAQAMVRISENDSQDLVVMHTFAAPLPAEICIPLPDNDWQVAGCFPTPMSMPEVHRNELHFLPSKEWEGQVIYLNHCP